MMGPVASPATEDAIYSLLAAMSNPQEHKKLLDQLVAERKQIAAEQEKLANLKAGHDQLAADRKTFEAECAAETDRLTARKNAVEVEAQRVATGWTQLGELRKDLAAQKDELEQSKRAHAEALALVAKLRATLAT